MWNRELAAEVASGYLSGLGRRWAHVQTVGRLADELATTGKISADVAAAAWLHDVGYAEQLSTTGLHPLDGAAFLATQGAPSAVVGLVAWHTGAAFEADERGLRLELAAMPDVEPSDLDTLTLLDLVAAPSSTASSTRGALLGFVADWHQSPHDPRNRIDCRSRTIALADRCGRPLSPLSGSICRCRTEHLDEHPARSIHDSPHLD